MEAVGRSQRFAPTVLGPVTSEELGGVLPHEHLTIDNGFNTQPVPGIDPDELVELQTIASTRVWTRGRADNLRLDRDSEIVEALADYRAAGGGSLVEMTTVGNGRDLGRMQEVSRASGVHVIATTGLYVDATHPADLKSLGVDDLADHFVAELTSASPRCGAIGEVGLSRQPTDAEWRALEAAAAASQRTGAPLWIHITTLEPLPALLEWETVHRSAQGRTAICHMDHDLRDLRQHVEALEAGFLLTFDGFGYPAWSRGPFAHTPTDAQRVEAVLELAAQGWSEHLLISHDVCQKIQLPQYAGYGYAHIERNVRGLMRELGGSDDLFEQITRRTPQRLLCWASE